ncbi:uncharacterized protein DFL_007863 [Arthrobotrys flagrans]|uniref:Uncharacterized protein n=1 Tax=Arthrobotrys flagrans TaxID=97331 RepID=A0A436ZWX8_ARTFL|nr:hypothetical protein DFL_007863 [Arthrobotrys flagrans]
MKFTAVFLSLLSLASELTTTPVPAEETSILEARQTKTTTFSITNLYNYGLPHSVTAYLNFEFKSSAGGQANCTASQRRNIATTPLYTRCAKPGVGFGFDRVGGGYVLTIAHRYSKNKNIDAASLYIPDEHVKRANNTANPNASFDYIDYPTKFTLISNPFIIGAVHGPVRKV